MLEARDYDTKEGITKIIKTVKGLHDLYEARKGAANRGEELDSFFVLRGWYFDSDGRAGRLTHSPGDEIPFPGMADVVPYQALTVSMQNARFGWSLGHPTIPPADGFCTICHRGWSIKNVLDSMRFVEDREIYTHRSCYILKLNDKQFEFTRQAFYSAGFAVCTFKPIPNLRTPGDDLTPDGYEVRTPFGKFTMGRRKRVWEIKWEETSADDEDLSKSLFADEEYHITKGPNYIHAWSPEKVAEYLGKVFEYLKAKPV